MTCIVALSHCSIVVLDFSWIVNTAILISFDPCSSARPAMGSTGELAPIQLQAVSEIDPRSHPAAACRWPSSACDGRTQAAAAPAGCPVCQALFEGAPEERDHDRIQGDGV